VRIALNALPINNFSGRRVLLGHLRNLAMAGLGRHSFHVLHHAGNRDLRSELGANVEWVECAGVGQHWIGRSLWEADKLRSTLRRIRADRLISTSGALSLRAGVPQWVWAQNPWCFFPAFHFGLTDRIKAGLQRSGYRRAQRQAEAIFYLSDFMARTYAANALASPRHGATTFVGVDDEIFDAAQVPLNFEQRDGGVVCVSVMTPHKAIEDLVDAMAIVARRQEGVLLTLVGPWSDPSYRVRIEERIVGHGLADRVQILGGVAQSVMLDYYRRARVFCLLSRCESFGIPAVEAQAFGTPCVVADACAPPEIAGPGGIVVPPGDPVAAANAVERLLSDSVRWVQASEAALANVERFRWSRVSMPMIEWLESVATTR